MTRVLKTQGRRRRALMSLMYHDCATAVMTEVFDGVMNRLEDAGAPGITVSESAWLHEEIGKIADRFHARALKLCQK